MWGIGAALGLALHIGMDLLFWFSPVDLLWPASALGWAGPARRLPAARIASARRLTSLSFGYSLVVVVVSFVLPHGAEAVYRLLLLVPMALVALPASLYLTWRVRKALLVTPRPALSRSPALLPGPLVIHPQTQTG